jgi:hypothetical protein
VLQLLGYLWLRAAGVAGSHVRAVEELEGDLVVKGASSNACFAKLRHQATPEDVDYRAERGLDRAFFMKLLGGNWIGAHDNLAICASSGVGKIWLACARGHKACRDAWFCISVSLGSLPRSRSPAATADTSGCKAP